MRGSCGFGSPGLRRLPSTSTRTGSLDDQDEEAFAEIMEITFAEQHRWKNVTSGATPSLPTRRSSCTTSSALLIFRRLNYVITCLSRPPGLLAERINSRPFETSTEHPDTLVGGSRLPSPHRVLHAQFTHSFHPSSRRLTIFPRINHPGSLQNPLLVALSRSPPREPYHHGARHDSSPRSHATHLTVSQTYVCGFAEHLFVALTCPALEELHVSFLDELASSRETWVAVADLLARSRPTAPASQPLQQLHPPRRPTPGGRALVHPTTSSKPPFRVLAGPVHLEQVYHRAKARAGSIGAERLPSPRIAEPRL